MSDLIDTPGPVSLDDGPDGGPAPEPTTAPTAEGEKPAEQTPEQLAAAAAEAEAKAKAEAEEAAKAQAETSRTKEFVALQQQQRKLHRERQAFEAERGKLKADIAAERAKVEHDQKLVAEFRTLASRAVDDPKALLDSLGVDVPEFFDAMTRHVLGEQPSADHRVARLEKTLKQREEAEAKAKAEAEANAKAEAERVQQEQHTALIEANSHAVATFLEHDPEAFPTLREAVLSTDGLMAKEVVNLALEWQNANGAILPMPKACEMVEAELLERSVQRFGKYLESPKLRQRLLETFRLQPIPPPAPTPAAPVPAPATPRANATEPGRPADVRANATPRHVREADKIEAERMSKYERLVRG